MGGFQDSAKFPGLVAYSASKAALACMAQCLAEEFRERGIRSNCLALGSVDTEMLRGAFPGYRAPVTAEAMGNHVADFALNGHRLYNGKVLPVAVTTP
jgi:NAD(P)-dependent dehydrogenase (short-subunit alcohol dehydrogenase family)